MTGHPLARIATCEDSFNIHPSTKYKVTDASAEHNGKDEISLDKVS
jgi:hypothetical protein